MYTEFAIFGAINESDRLIQLDLQMNLYTQLEHLSMSLCCWLKQYYKQHPKANCWVKKDITMDLLTTVHGLQLGVKY